jgi:hypothetical protein
MRKNNSLGIVLILIGLMIILGNTGFFKGEMVLFIISLCLFGGYFLTGGRSKKGSIGFLIPACIILMIGSFAFLEDTLGIIKGEGGIFFFMLGTAFLLIYFIHCFRKKDMSFGERNWPAITGISIYIFGSFIFILEHYDVPLVRTVLQNLWPIGLIAAGVIILANNFKRKNL